MWPHKNSATPYSSLWSTVKYTFPKAWSAGPRFCVAMAASALVAALLAPVAVVILAVLISNIETMIAGPADSAIMLTPWILLAGGAAILGAVCSAVSNFNKLRLGDELSLRVQKEVLEHATSLDLKTLEDRNTQDILERARQEPGKNILNLAEGLLKVLSSSIQAFGLVAILFWIEPFWSSILLLLGIPLIIFRLYLSSVQHELKRNRTTSRRWTKYYARQMAERESVPSTKILRLAKLLLDRYEIKMREIVQSNRRFYCLQTLVTLACAFASIGVLMMAMVVVGRQAATGTITIAQFTAFWMAAWRFRGALSNLATSFSNVWKAQLSIANTREFLNIESTIENRGTLRPFPLRGEIELVNLSFHYTDCKRPTIRNVSLKIRAGETVAIVGPNGAGKTTLAKLLTRLYVATEGKILIDGISIDELELKSLHDRIAFVMQRPTRFEATALENIAFGDWPKLLDSPQEVHRIAKMARVDSMIREMPQGYDTLLGRKFGHYDLSGGQWQKLAIARALACDPAIVLLDEPAANLDVHSEHALYQGIHELIHDRTTILISHRFSTVRMADRIFVLNEGQLIEEGTHEELVASRGTYSAMCKTHEATVRIKSPYFASRPVHNTEASLD